MTKFYVDPKDADKLIGLADWQKKVEDEQLQLIHNQSALAGRIYDCENQITVLTDIWNASQKQLGELKIYKEQLATLKEQLATLSDYSMELEYQKNTARSFSKELQHCLMRLVQLEKNSQILIDNLRRKK